MTVKAALAMVREAGIRVTFNDDKTFDLYGWEPHGTTHYRSRSTFMDHVKEELRTHGHIRTPQEVLDDNGH